MSLIHEALEKIEQEKKTKWRRPPPIPEVSEPAAAKVSPKEGESPKTIYAMAGILLFFFAIGVVYLMTRSQTEKWGGPGGLSSPPPRRSLPLSLPSFDRSRFALTGITRVNADWTAIINNQLVRVGDGVSGATVEAIQKERVLLDFKGQKITLSLYGESPSHFTRLEISLNKHK